MLPKKIIYDRGYVGGSLAILIKNYFTKKKIIIFEKDFHLGGAWKNNYKKKLKNIDVACHLIVTPNKTKSEKIINLMKLFNIKLKKIDKQSFYSDTKNWKAYGKKGPALICTTGWSDMLNKVKDRLLKKKNITILKNSRVNKIIVGNKIATVYLKNNLNICCKKLFIPTFCDLSEFFIKQQKVNLPKKDVKNIHYVFEFIGSSNILNKDYQGFWDLKSNIFDRLSVSSYSTINRSKKKITICCRVSKKFKKKLDIIDKKSILSFLKFNKLVLNGKIVKSKRVIYDCPYRTVTQFKKIKNLIKINKAPIDIINTRYMGHFLWQIAKGKNI
jgi:hypothetical protein|tara:strand:+ start:540 stop:1526 length:987 start_codon:yes stop_codon:yes gene_type:complete